MSTDKEEFALYCEAKMTKSENVWELKVVFTDYSKKIICCHLPLHYRNG